MIKIMYFAMVAVGLLNPGFCYSSCEGIEELYEKRKEITLKYEEQIGSDYLKNKEKADLYNEQIRVIDSKYRKIINEFFFEYEENGDKLLKECCGKDKYLVLVCNLINYYRDRNGGSFLRYVPVQKKELNDLWTIDEILLKDPDYLKKPHPKVFDRASFVSLFLTSIYQLAANGNPNAISKLIAIQSSAEGEYAEYLDDLMLKLIEYAPEVIINNWNILRECSSSVRLETTDYKVRANNIIEKYKRLCKQVKNNPQDCKEIMEFLQRLK